MEDGGVYTSVFHEEQENGVGLFTDENRATSRFGSRFRDMVVTCKASARGDLWRSGVLKATSRCCEPPNMKFVKNLLAGIKYYGCDVISSTSAPRIIVETLKMRLAEPDWIVAFKSLTVLHYLLRETVSQPFVDLVIKQKEELLVHEFKDRNPKALANAPLVVSYSKYLMAFLNCKERANYPPLKNNMLDAYANYEKCFHRKFVGGGVSTFRRGFLELQSAAMALLNVEFSLMERKTIATMTTGMLAKDLTHFWLSIQTTLVELHKTSVEEEAEVTKEEMEQLMAKFDVLCKEADIHIPDLEVCEHGSWTRPNTMRSKDLLSAVSEEEVIHSIGEYYY